MNFSAYERDKSILCFYSALKGHWNKTIFAAFSLKKVFLVSPRVSWLITLVHLLVLYFQQAWMGPQNARAPCTRQRKRSQVQHLVSDTTDFLVIGYSINFFCIVLIKLRVVCTCGDTHCCKQLFTSFTGVASHHFVFSPAFYCCRRLESWSLLLLLPTPRSWITSRKIHFCQQILRSSGSAL